MINLHIGDKLELKNGRELVVVKDDGFPCRHICVLGERSVGSVVLKDGTLLNCAKLQCCSTDIIHLEFVEGGSNEN